MKAFCNLFSLLFLENDLKTGAFCDKMKEICPKTGRGGGVPNADGKVICICGAMMQSFNEWKPFTEQEAIERWNKRVGEVKS